MPSIFRAFILVVLAVKPRVVINTGVIALISLRDSINAQEKPSANWIGNQIHEIRCRVLLSKVPRLIIFRAKISGLTITNMDFVKTTASFLVSTVPKKMALFVITIVSYLAMIELF